jgi:adhesin transport system outer membrane protein
LFVMKLKMALWATASVLSLGAHAASWNLARVLEAAWASHPLVMGKRSAQAAARDEQDGAQWQRYPSPSLEASTQSGGAGLLRIDQPLWAGGRITANIDAAGNRLDAAGAAIDEARHDLALRAIAATTEATRQQARQLHGQSGRG